MSIIQEKIYLGKNATGATLTFGLSRNTDFTGYQQEIDSITEETKQELINPIQDFEISKFKYGDTTGLRFYFLNSSNTTHSNTYINAGFSSTEIADKADVVRNSFYILDFYDTYINNIQTRIFTNYQTQIGTTPYFQFYGSQYYQMTHNNVPKWFLDEQYVDPIQIYVKFSFYNAKDGKLLLFYNNSINDITNPENMYFKANLHPYTKTWNFLSSVNAYELNPNTEYVQRNNETFQNFENKKQNYPSGNLFKDDGTYDDSQ